MNYTKEHVEFFNKNVRGNSFAHLTEIFNKRFATSLTLSQIKAACKNRKLKCGRDTRFQKGQESFNKGTKGVMKSNKTSFKKGQMPPNHKPVGSERISVDGYIEVKIAEPKKWRFKHVVIWESTHGKTPEGHVVIFADRNKMNTDINNLLLIDRKQLLYMNRNAMISENKAITETAANIAKVATKIFEKQKNV